MLYRRVARRSYSEFLDAELFRIIRKMNIKERLVKRNMDACHSRRCGVKETIRKNIAIIIIIGIVIAGLFFAHFRKVTHHDKSIFESVVKSENIDWKKDLKNFPTTVFFSSEYEWSDKGDYYELVGPVTLRCYDLIEIARFNDAKIGTKIESEGGNTYKKVKSGDAFQNEEDYIGELLDSMDVECEVYDLGNGYGHIQSELRGKVCDGTVHGSDVPIRILKSAIISSDTFDAELTAEEYYSSGLKTTYEKEERDAGFEVVYYPEFGEDNYINAIYIDNRTPSLGY